MRHAHLAPSHLAEDIKKLEFLNVKTHLKDTVIQANYAGFRPVTDCGIDGKPENRLLSSFGA